MYFRDMLFLRDAKMNVCLAGTFMRISECPTVFVRGWKYSGSAVAHFGMTRIASWQEKRKNAEAEAPI